MPPPCEWVRCDGCTSFFCDPRLLYVTQPRSDVLVSFSSCADGWADVDLLARGLLCRESCREGDQVIIFCPTKQFCHNCALKVTTLDAGTNDFMVAERVYCK